MESQQKGLATELTHLAQQQATAREALNDAQRNLVELLVAHGPIPARHLVPVLAAVASGSGFQR